MTRDNIKNDYFRWLTNIIRAKTFSKETSRTKLLMRLHDTEFTYTIPKDRNRAEDGIDLRYRYAVAQGYGHSSRTIVDYLDGPCSVLEMMVALAMRCEETIMDDPNVGDRTAQWFWGMIASLGLGPMIDACYDRQQVDDILVRFMNRNYEPNGKGGLFTIRNYDRDMRDVEIWIQLCSYLNTIT